MGIVRDLLAVIGAIMIVYGVAGLSVPWAWVVGGGMVLAGSLLWSNAAQVDAATRRKPVREPEAEARRA